MKKLFAALLGILFVLPALGKEYKLFSPDKETEVVVTVNTGISIKASHHNSPLFSVDNISLDIKGKHFKTGIKQIKTESRNSVDRMIHPEIQEKYSKIRDHYNELLLEYKGDFSLTIRAYNNGIAYRFNTTFDEDIIVNRENFNLHFYEEDSIYVQKSETFNSSYETPYEHSAVKDVTSEGYCCLPALVQKQNGMNVVITESNLVDYPGLWLKATGTSSLKSANPGYPVFFISEGNAYGQGQVKKHADHIARVKGIRNFPWRIFAIAENDAESNLTL